MAKRIIILGVSTFTASLLRFLAGHDKFETVAVDHDEDRINAVTEFADQPIIGSVRNQELLNKLEVARADHVVVSLGDLESSLVCVLYLRDLGAQRIIVKALNEEHVSILRLLRVDEIVFPERRTAELTALRLLHPEARESMILSSGHRVVEITVPEALVGREIKPLEIKETCGVEVLMVIDATAGIGVGIPDVYLVSAGDKFVILGTDDEIDRFEKRFLQ